MSNFPDRWTGGRGLFIILPIGTAALLEAERVWMMDELRKPLEVTSDLLHPKGEAAVQ